MAAVVDLLDYGQREAVERAEDAVALGSRTPFRGSRVYVSAISPEVFMADGFQLEWDDLRLSQGVIGSAADAANGGVDILVGEPSANRASIRVMREPVEPDRAFTVTGGQRHLKAIQ